MTKKKKSNRKEEAQSKSLSTTIRKFPHLFAIAAIAVLLCVFFFDVTFKNQTFLPPDAVASKSTNPFTEQSFEQGEYPLWNPYIFSGMPSFASLQAAPYVDLLSDVLRVIALPLRLIFVNGDFALAFLNYLLFAVGIYLLILKRTEAIPIALFGAFAFLFQPQVIAFVAYGHGTKLTTSALIPVIFLLLDEFLERKQLRYFALLALAVGLQLLRAHTQMAYYTFMMIGLYLIYWVVYSKIKKLQWGEILKPAAFSVGALVLGVLMSSWLYLSVLEYADYSIRGGAAGLDYGYATGWSFAPKEILTFFVPSFLGFGGQTYWGEMPFTDFPLYMGIVPLMLAIVGVALRRDKYTLFFGIMGLLALVISFGNHLPILYRPLYEFLPFFNKFRVPSMILILLQFSVVVLASLGLHAFLGLRDEKAGARVRKILYGAIGVCGVFLLFMLIGKSTYQGWMASSAKQLGAAAQESAYDMAASDALKVFVFALAAAVLMLMHLQKKVTRNVFLAGILALTIIDLWVVDFRITNPHPKANEAQYFAETPAVRYLKEIYEPFRIYQAYDDKTPNWYMYHKIQNIQGYHAAKLKIYQEFLEKSRFDPTLRNRFGFPPFMDKYFKVSISNGQPSLQQVPRARVAAARFASDNAVLDMLNVKYLISHYPLPDDRFEQVVAGRPAVFENKQALPRAYFAQSVRIMPDIDEFYRYLSQGNFDPAREAILHEEISTRIEPSPDNTVSVESYAYRHIKLAADVKAPALLVLSEVYYPAGWRAYVDGRETAIHRANAILRAIVLQPGTHKIEFVFSPATFKLGLSITAIILIGMLGLLVYDLRFRKPAETAA